MKTFDEAFKTITSNWDKVVSNAIESEDERFANQTWVDFIERRGFQSLVRLLAGHDPLVELYSDFHILFEIGLLVGMEMERAEVTLETEK